jgi:hypothetical protein
VFVAVIVAVFVFVFVFVWDVGKEAQMVDELKGKAWDSQRASAWSWSSVWDVAWAAAWDASWDAEMATQWADKSTGKKLVLQMDSWLASLLALEREVTRDELWVWVSHWACRSAEHQISSGFQMGTLRKYRLPGRCNSRQDCSSSKPYLVRNNKTEEEVEVQLEVPQEAEEVGDSKNTGEKNCSSLLLCKSSESNPARSKNRPMHMLN